MKNHTFFDSLTPPFHYIVMIASVFLCATMLSSCVENDAANAASTTISMATISTVQDDQTGDVVLSEDDGTESTSSKLSKINMYEENVLIRDILFSYREDGLLSEVNYRYLEDGLVTDESLTKYTYNAQGCLTLEETMYSWFSWLSDDQSVHDEEIFEAHDRTEYIYDSTGKLIHCSSTSMSGWFDRTYEYDERGNLEKTTSLFETGYRVEERHYDSNENLSEIQTTTYYDGQDPIVEITSPNISACSYPPFSVHSDKSGSSTFITIEDPAGNSIWSYPFFAPQFTVNNDGSLKRIVDGGSWGSYRIYMFGYDGEDPVLDVQEYEDSGRKKLEYPISEEDCYVILQNYWGLDADDMESGEYQIVAEHYGESTRSIISFCLYHLNPNTRGYTWADSFTVNIYNGTCESDTFDDIFQADDYYY